MLRPKSHAAEALTLKQAAERAQKSPGTIRNWCESEGIGRRVGGVWCVSKVALEMYLDGETDALDQYLQGYWESEVSSLTSNDLAYRCGHR